MKRWQLCRKIENVFGGIPACFVQCSSNFQVFRESVRVLLDRPDDVSARFAKETKKFKVNKFGRM